MPNFIAISGPTGVGKTVMAIALTKEIDAEIISFDSRQIYHELKIGVARPSNEELNQVKHHLIAHRSIQESYSAQDFVNEFYQLTQNEQDAKNYILVGGTGFYLQAVENGLDDLPDISQNTREKIQVEFNEKGIEYLQNRLKEIDSKSFATIDIQNPRRVQRILELWDEHKLVYSDLIQNKSSKIEYSIKHIVLDIPRTLLYERINFRVDEMIGDGLMDEVKSLIPYRHLNALNTVGYKELFDYFDGKLSLEEAIDKIKQHSRNYAKRQITWNKKFLASALWINHLEDNHAIEKIKEYVFF